MSDTSSGSSLGFPYDRRSLSGHFGSAVVLPLRRIPVYVVHGKFISDLFLRTRDGGGRARLFDSRVMSYTQSSNVLFGLGSFGQACPVIHSSERLPSGTQRGHSSQRCYLPHHGSSHAETDKSSRSGPKAASFSVTDLELSRTIWIRYGSKASTHQSKVQVLEFAVKCPVHLEVSSSTHTKSSGPELLTRLQPLHTMMLHQFQHATKPCRESSVFRSAFTSSRGKGSASRVNRLHVQTSANQSQSIGLLYHWRVKMRFFRMYFVRMFKAIHLPFSGSLG